MSEISIQIRRVTEKVRQYFEVFGFIPYPQMSRGRASIRGKRRLGFDEIECVVAETARGTSIGFYAINSFQGLIYGVPYILALTLLLLNQIEGVSKYITGEEALLSINWLKLFLGTSEVSFQLVLILLILAVLPFILEFYHQRIRLSNLKSRFSFFTREAIWETREAPPSLLALQAARSVIIHGWMLAIIYFGVFSSQTDSINELTNLYQTNNEDLYYAISDAFSLTIGLIIGLLSANKAISMRKEQSRFDKRSRITGNLIERRIDPILFGVSSASYTIIIFGFFVSATFMKDVPIMLGFQMMFFALFGAVLAGLIHQEGMLWTSMSYAIFIFFSSLVFIFRTGDQPAYAFIIILQLFFIPIPFILQLSVNFGKILKKYKITSVSWLFESIPIFSLISIFDLNRKKEISKKRYLESLEQEILIDDIEPRIQIGKEILLDKNSPAHKLVLHYYELILSYTASFEEDKFIYIPDSTQLNKWWGDITKQNVETSQNEFVDFTDQILWDPKFLPPQKEILKYEKIGETMVLAIK